MSVIGKLLSASTPQQKCAQKCTKGFEKSEKRKEGETYGKESQASSEKKRKFVHSPPSHADNDRMYRKHAQRTTRIPEHSQLERRLYSGRVPSGFRSLYRTTQDRTNQTTRLDAPTCRYTAGNREVHVLQTMFEYELKLIK